LLVQSLMTKARLEHWLLNSNATPFDKRMQLEHLFESGCILRCASYLDPDGSTHPRASHSVSTPARPPRERRAPAAVRLRHPQLPLR
jgi:hypothetical protein